MLQRVSLDCLFLLDSVPDGGAARALVCDKQGTRNSLQELSGTKITNVNREGEVRKQSNIWKQEVLIKRLTENNHFDLSAKMITDRDGILWGGIALLLRCVWMIHGCVSINTR